MRGKSNLEECKMEKNHVVIELDKFLELQKKAEELEKIKEESLVLSKAIFTLQKDYSGKRINLCMKGDIAINIADDLYKKSEFTKEFISDSPNINASSVFEIGEYSLGYKKMQCEESEIQNNESEGEE
jgi:hypothetical protein